MVYIKKKAAEHQRMPAAKISNLVDEPGQSGDGSDDALYDEEGTGEDSLHGPCVGGEAPNGIEDDAEYGYKLEEQDHNALRDRHCNGLGGQELDLTAVAALILAGAVQHGCSGLCGETAGHGLRCIHFFGVSRANVLFKTLIKHHNKYLPKINAGYFVFVPRTLRGPFSPKDYHIYTKKARKICKFSKNIN